MKKKELLDALVNVPDDGEILFYVDPLSCFVSLGKGYITGTTDFDGKRPNGAIIYFRDVMHD